MRYTTTSKYHARKKVIDGITFDSVHEANRYAELKLLEQNGWITGLILQKKYVLIPAQYAESDEVYTKGKHKGEPKRGPLLEREVAYFADFEYIDTNGELVVEDAKSKATRTKDYVIKRKLMLQVHGIRIKEIERSKR